MVFRKKNRLGVAPPPNRKIEDEDEAKDFIKEYCRKECSKFKKSRCHDPECPLFPHSTVKSKDE